MIVASERVRKYFDSMESNVSECYKLATEARSQGFDPSQKVDVKIAKNLAERVVGLISILAPQIADSTVVERIIELEKEYGLQDWRVAMVIAHEIALQKHCKFKDDIEAMEVGIRVGFAYVTVGVVSSPLEGFTNLELKDRRDNKGKYFCINYAGPVRNAGGTAAAVSVIIADYVRKQMGFEKYDPDEKEINRCHTELMDYHERVTNLQYVPSKKECDFLMANLPVEIGGDASEKFEVSNYKDLPRIKPNRLRSGYCLIQSSCIPLKAPKLWKKLSKWMDEMNMTDWAFMEQFLAIQKEAKSSKSSGSAVKKEEGNKIYPIYTYMSDLVGGRPVIGHPIRPGGLRLRYGRSRVSGFSAQCVHPATMIILDDFLAVGTQFKVERPGKAAAFTSCDTIMGPTVLLDDGSVVYLDTVAEAKQVNPRVSKILHLGDVLINYGDFFDRACTLFPPGYCEEWWVLELEKIIVEKYGSLDLDSVSSMVSVDKETLRALFKNPMKEKLPVLAYFELSRLYKVPLHPVLTAFWKLVTVEQFEALLGTLRRSKIISEEGSIKKCVLPYDAVAKKALENAAIVHSVASKEFIVLDKIRTFILFQILGIKSLSDIDALLKAFDVFKVETPDVLAFINSVSTFTLRDKAGVYIGARMGRPEKAKMRKITSHPYTVMPKERKIEDPQTKQTRTYVVTEHAIKKVLREKYEINANKDGTIRYDGSEVPITHFKPVEVGAPIEKLIELGYTHDIHGEALERTDQILELFPQDIVLPCCTVSPNEPCDEILFRVAAFVDELLGTLYGMKPYYNLKTKSDLIGHYVFGLAPHTSAATAGRIVGFTKSQGMFCHPLMHAAMRRDCDGDETCIFLLLDGFLNFATEYLPQHRGGTMDAPLVLTSIINPAEVDDMVFNMDIAWKYNLDFYEAACAYKKPWDVKVPLFNDCLGTERQFEGMGFTHDTTNFNEGVLCSAYKTLPSMRDKVDGQMRLAEKIMAVDESDVAQITIEKHFLRDTMGNLRKFSMQEFRCVKCNTKYRRPPISGKCKTCSSQKIIFTISKGSVVKYLDLSIELGKKYSIAPYVQQCLELLRNRVDGVFGREKVVQSGLGEFF